MPVAPDGVTGTVRVSRNVHADRFIGGVSMAVGEDTPPSSSASATGSRPPPTRSRGTTPAALHVGTVFRVLVFAALAAFLLYYVGPRDIARRR